MQTTFCLLAFVPDHCYSLGQATHFPDALVELPRPRASIPAYNLPKSTIYNNAMPPILLLLRGVAMGPRLLSHQASGPSANTFDVYMRTIHRHSTLFAIGRLDRLLGTRESQGRLDGPHSGIALTTFSPQTLKELVFSVNETLPQQLEATFLNLAGAIIGIGISTLARFLSALRPDDSASARAIPAIFLVVLAFFGAWYSHAHIACTLTPIE